MQQPFKALVKYLTGCPRADKSMTCDQGHEMVKHAEIIEKAGIAICFRDPHSPWQHGSNENINGLIRNTSLKKDRLDRCSVEELDTIVYQLKLRLDNALITTALLKYITEVLKIK